MKKVTFCGHRDLSGFDIDFIEGRIREEVEILIKQGATRFLLGGYGDFDNLCAGVIRRLKEKYPYIESVFVTPYIDKKVRKDLYDYIEFPPIESAPKRFAIIKRNEYMVEMSDAVIGFIIHNWGGAAKTLEYARKKRKHIIHIKKEPT